MPLNAGLTDRLVQFCRHLRQHGFQIGSSQIELLVTALTHVQLTNPHDFYWASHAMLVKDRAQTQLFRYLFDAFWSGSLGTEPAREAMPKQQAELTGMPERDSSPAAGSQAMVRLQSAQTAGGRYSALEVLRRRDFAEFNDDERRALEQWLLQAAYPIWQRPGRRWTVPGGRRLDFRRSLQRNLRRGGEWLIWARRGPRPVERPLVLLSDVSGSMAGYSRALIALAAGLSRSRRSPVEVFTFSTRLTRITGALSGRWGKQPMARIASMVPDWAGGTRIGSALDTYLREWGARISGRGAVVLLVTDGWDRGDETQLARAMRRLRRSSWRLIWLNPLQASAGYEPRTRGAQTILANADQALPAHNLESIQRLLRALSRLDAGAGQRAKGNAWQVGRGT